MEQKKERDELKQLEQRLAHEEKMQELKEQTAAAFKKAGVISESEFEMIRKETLVLKAANEKLLKETTEKVYGKTEPEKAVKEVESIDKKEEKEIKKEKVEKAQKPKTKKSPAKKTEDKNKVSKTTKSKETKKVSKEDKKSSNNEEK